MQPRPTLSTFLRSLALGLPAGMLLALWLAPAATTTAAEAGAPAPGPTAGGGAPAPGAPPTDAATDDETGTRAPARPVGAGSDPAFGVLAGGRVHEPDGTGVEGATLTLTGPDPGSPAELVALSGPDGRWSLFGLAPGAWRLAARAGGYAPVELELDVPAGPSWRRDVVLEPLPSIPVRLETPAGEPLRSGPFDVSPLASLGVVATSAPPTGTVGPIHGRAPDAVDAGCWLVRGRGAPPDLDARYQGLLRLDRRPPLFASAVLREAVLATVPIDGSEPELVFVIDEDLLDAATGSVRARVVASTTGEPLTDVRLGHRSGGFDQPVEVAEDGVLHWRSVPAGTWELERLDAAGELEWLRREVHVRPGLELDLGRIELEPAIEIRVRLVGPDGEPRANEAVRVAPLGPDAEPDAAAGVGVGGPHSRTTFRTNAEGLARVGGLGRGPAVVRAGGSAGRAAAAARVDGFDGAELTLELADGTRVDVVGRRAAGVEELVLGPDGLPLLHRPVLPDELWLAPGRYTLVNRTPDGDEQRTRPFDVGREPRTLERSIDR